MSQVMTAVFVTKYSYVPCFRLHLQSLEESGVCYWEEPAPLSPLHGEHVLPIQRSHITGQLFIICSFCLFFVGFRFLQFNNQL